ncbi:MAG: hypothetical protein ABWY83_10665 [Actinomycetota bacterium]
MFRSSFALIARIFVLVIWLGSDAFDTVFTTWIFPLLGVIFLPFTAIAFTIAKLADAGIVIVVMSLGMGVMLDAASAALASGRKRY